MNDQGQTFARKGRALLPGQVSELTVIGSGGGGLRVVLTADEIIEAPNWTPDGRWLIFNAGGELWRIAPDGGRLERIDTGTIRDLNNDHCLSPDGATLYISNNDGHIYRMPVDGGGEPVRVTNPTDHPFRHYLHAVSPDGATLAYTGIATIDGVRDSSIYTIPAAGGPDTKLTAFAVPSDGPEYSPDGRWLYFNTEQFSPGQAQIARTRPDGSGLEQLTFDDRVNWFPHFPTDGTRIAYLSYPPGTQGHPENKDVILRLMNPDGSGTSDIVALFGGQGTINVNSWAPDGEQLAFVAYPMRG